MTMTPPAWTPTSTYRLQLGPAFTFADVERIAPYVGSLGIEALYLSPMLKARPGSTHGYDICDHAAVNPDLGTEPDLARLAAVASAHGLRLLADIVPNHMGVDPQVNPWWREVLENGPCSPFAEYFDIDWEPVTPHLRQKVLLPILGDQYGRVLENQEIRAVREGGTFYAEYYDSRLPLAPQSWIPILEAALTPVRDARGAEDPAVLEIESIMTALSHLPPRATPTPHACRSGSARRRS